MIFLIQSFQFSNLFKVSKKWKLTIFNFFLLGFTAYATINFQEVIPASEGICDGILEIETTGTAGPFSIQVYNSLGLQISEQLSFSGVLMVENLCPDSYTVEVTNLYGCKTTLSTTIIECSVIEIGNIESAISPPSSCNSSDGVVYFRGFPISGGTAPYSYLWNTGATTLGLSNLSAGVYTLTVTDVNNCSAEFDFDLMASGSPEVNLLSLVPQCEGFTDGSILILASSSEISDFDFQWSNGVVTNNAYESSISNLAAGTYSVTVTVNSTGCTSSASFEVPIRNSTGPFNVEGIVNNTCPEFNSGSITLQVSGGNPPYSYLWNTGSGSGSISNLASGNYYYTVTDDCGRTISSSHAVGVYPEMVVESAVIYGCPGNINLNISGGTPPYLYQWDNGQTTSTATSLINNTDYCVTITDSKGCAIEDCFFVPIDDEAFEVYISEIQHISDASPTGSVTVAGETPGHYSYNWSTGTTGQTISNLSPGSYTVTV